MKRKHILLIGGLLLFAAATVGYIIYKKKKTKSFSAEGQIRKRTKERRKARKLQGVRPQKPIRRPKERRVRKRRIRKMFP